MKLGIMPTPLKINLIPTPQLKNGAGEGGNMWYTRPYLENLAWQANNEEI